MPNRAVNTVALLALAASLSAALPAFSQTNIETERETDIDGAAPSARVGRVALAQGTVSIASDVGAELTAAQVNWPVTSGNTITTGQGARTELRIGSTSIRLEGDSSLEVLQLDDASTRLRLHHGSVSVRVPSADVAAGFELETPQARVRLQQPGRVRIDAERVAGTSAVSVFDGAALVDGGGSQLTVRAGKRAEVGDDDDVRTLAATRDAFDEWSAARDRYDDNAASARYVTREMTGYEDLDRYGSWQDDADYGPLWTPAVAAGWVPYRDGSWTWLDPWGWTWVDNAPWGYAPFHYGRWVQVRNRWAWAPGRRPEHLVWAPALVGWVGGAGWNLTFRDRGGARPAAGWYPLSPHDRFVPTYRAPAAHLRWLNAHVRDDIQRDPRRLHDFRPQGLTVVPQDRFGQPGRVNVPRAPGATVPPALVQRLPAGAPPAAPAWANRPHRIERADRMPARAPDRGVERGPDRFAERIGDRNPERNVDRNPDRNPDRNRDRFSGAGRFDNGGRAPGRIETARNDGRIDTGRIERDGFVRGRQPGQPQGLIGQATTPGLVAPVTPVQPQGVVSPTPHLPAQPLTTVTSPTPRQSPQPLTGANPVPQPLPGVSQIPGAGFDNGRRDRGERWERGDRGDRREQMEAWRNRQPAQPMQPMQPAQPQAQPMPQPVPQQIPQPAPRFERPEPRAERPREMPAAFVPRPAPAAASAPAPAPAPAAAPRPAPAPATPAAANANATAREDRRPHGEDRNRRER